MRRDLNINTYVGLESEKDQLKKAGDFFRAEDTGKLFLVNEGGAAVEVSGSGVLPYINIRQLFIDSSNQEKIVNYIVSGDSTRSNGYNEMIDYYTSQLDKLNVSVYNNARSGAKGEDWLNNTDATATLANAIANTPNDGENTILEYSFGINDYTGNTLAEIKSIIKNGIEGYLAVKPKATVLMTIPIATANLSRNTDLFDIYTEVSSELGLELIDTYNATLAVQGDSDYYYDSTHPNKFGSRRIVNFIFNQVLPIELLSIMTLEEYPTNTVTPPASELSVGIEDGYYNNSGTPLANASWRRFIEIDVEPNFELIIEHQGNRYEAIFMDSFGALVELRYTTVIVGESFKRAVTVPAGASKLRANISSLGAVTGTPSIKYNLAPTTYLNIQEINVDLDIRNTIYRSLPIQSSDLLRLDLNDSTSVTGTTVSTEIFSYDLPANSLDTSCLLSMGAWFEKVGASGTYNVRVFLNGNATPIYVATSAAANRISSQLNKIARIKDGNLIAKQGSFVDVEETILPIVQPFDVATSNNFKIFIQLANGADLVKLTGFYLEQKKIT